MRQLPRVLLLSALLSLAAACGKSGQTSGPTGPTKGSGPTGLPSVPGEPDTSVQTALPPIPALIGVTARVVGDSASISFVPVEGAKDYRVYVLT
jgi:hypothetical protein